MDPNRNHQYAYMIASLLRSISSGSQPSRCRKLRSITLASSCLFNRQHMCRPVQYATSYSFLCMQATTCMQVGPTYITYGMIRSIMIDDAIWSMHTVLGLWSAIILVHSNQPRTQAVVVCMDDWLRFSRAPSQQSTELYAVVNDNWGAASCLFICFAEKKFIM